MKAVFYNELLDDAQKYLAMANDKLLKAASVLAAEQVLSIGKKEQQCVEGHRKIVEYMADIYHANTAIDDLPSLD